MLQNDTFLLGNIANKFNKARLYMYMIHHALNHNQECNINTVHDTLHGLRYLCNYLDPPAALHLQHVLEVYNRRF